jgi:hypothetical protein
MIFPPRLRAYRSVDALDKKVAFARLSQRLVDKRPRFQIAVIDDEEFTPLEGLRRHSYNINHLHDVSSIDELRRYDIILFDLIGVGMGLSTTMQGAHLIRETRKNFPEKIIVSYTGGGRPDLLETSIQFSDYIIRKDAGVEEWCHALDQAIEALANPAIVWKKLRHRLLDAGITPYQLAELEDLFVVKTLERFSLEFGRRLACE